MMCNGRIATVFVHRQVLEALPAVTGTAMASAKATLAAPLVHSQILEDEAVNEKGGALHLVLWGHAER